MRPVQSGALTTMCDWPPAPGFKLRVTHSAYKVLTAFGVQGQGLVQSLSLIVSRYTCLVK